jgi:hypothetical protein
MTLSGPPGHPATIIIQHGKLMALTVPCHGLNCAFIMRVDLYEVRVKSV